MLMVGAAPGCGGVPVMLIVGADPMVSMVAVPVSPCESLLLNDVNQF